MSRTTDLAGALRLTPGTPVRLAELDPAGTHGWSKPAGERATEVLLEKLADLQDRLWAEERQALLIVLQGIDASGKDGTIKKVATAFNPQGCSVTSFKVPSVEELAHDYLWRVHRRVPGKGEIGIFNRSHYEDVLVVRVKQLVPRAVWSKRYAQIRAFEELLGETGTRIVKLFLHISREEQRERFQARYDDPTKRWKFSLGDLEERKRWDDYMRAYEDAIARTSTAEAPWYVVPADRKWFRNLAVATIVADTQVNNAPAYTPDAHRGAGRVVE